ncbi:MAG: hypothetical protein IJU43_10295 [Lachnospiraceae bacterium]|nr:hypothetical protein [Lachnospiraceae bacterium]
MDIMDRIIISLRNNRNHKLIFAGIIIIEILALVAVFGVYAWKKWSAGSNGMNIGISVEDFQSDIIEYSSGWHINADTIMEPDTALIYGPFVYLPKGDYTLVVGYDCDSEQTIVPYSSGAEVKYIEANTIKLDPYLHAISYNFKVKEPVNKFEIRAYYDGNGELNLNEISVFRNLSKYKRLLVFLLICFVTIDICIWKTDSISANKEVILCISVITAFSCLPLMAQGMGYGEDLCFHLMRIEGLASEIRMGHIPVRMQAAWMHGNGHPISVFYGDILLYIPAILRIAGFTVNTSYTCYVALINLITVIVSYYSFKYIIGQARLSLVMTAAYTLSTCRLVMMYWGSNVGSYTAQAFFPMIAAVIYCIYSEANDTVRLNLRAALVLAIAMSGVIMSHVLSVEILLVALALFSVINIRRTLTVRTISTFAVAAVVTALLTLFFTVPFLDYFLNVDVAVTHSVNELPADIQHKGLDILQLFSFFETHDDYNHIPGLLLTATLIASVVIWINGKSDRTMKSLTVFSLIVVIISTSIFPWDWLAYNTKLFNYLSVIQFPSRYIPFACVSLTVILGMIIKKYENETNRKMLYSACVILMLIGPLAFFGQYLDQIPRVNYMDSADVDTDQYTSNYLRVNEDGEPIIKPAGEIEAEGAEVIESSKRGWTINMHIKAADTGGMVKLPLDNYKGYKGFDTTGREFDIIDDEYCKASFMVPPDYDGYITVSYIEPWYWRVSEIISLVAWIGLICYFAITRIYKTQERRRL